MYGSLIADIINHVKGIEEKRYLELGCHSGGTLSHIRAKSKLGVDINPDPNIPAYKMTTDNFFKDVATNMQNFDIIFIDAGHTVEQVIKDYNNSITRLNPQGVLFLHDMYPETENDTIDYRSGDGYKLLLWIKQHSKTITYTTINTFPYFGLTVIFNATIANINASELIYIYNDIKLNIATIDVETMKNIVAANT